MIIYYELIIVIGFVLFNIKATKKIGKFIMIVTAAILGVQFILIFGAALLSIGCQAILNLLCYKKGIQIGHISPASIVVSKFNLPRGSDLYVYLNNSIGSHPPYWDKTMKDTALIAIIQLI